MSDIKPKPRRKTLRKVPSIGQGNHEEWLGAEAHVPYHDRPSDWLRSFKDNAGGFTGLAVGLAFLGGAVLSGLLFSLLNRHENA